MESMLLKAYSIANELDLNKVASLRGIRKKYTWEEPLVLQDENLKDILGQEVMHNQIVFLFSFGAVVFFNIDPSGIDKVLKFLYNQALGVGLENYNKYSDDYELRINSSEEQMLTDEYLVVDTFEEYMPEIISTVIAKSVALERVEEKMSGIVDSIENVIESLEKGKQLISNRNHNKIVAKIVRYEYNMISYIMILDRPDITWQKSEAGELYDSLSEFFELNDRYEILRKKMETVNSIVDNFTSISNSIKGLFIDWVIVILILIEILMAIFER